MFPIQKILLPVDFSERSSQAVRFAADLAGRLNAEMILLHVLPPYHEFGGIELASAILTDLIAERHQDAERRLAGFLDEDLRGRRVRRVLQDGDPAHQIVECAHREQAGLVMMPTHGYTRFRRLLLGSVTAKVLHDADCPVWTTAHAEALHSGEFALRRILCEIGPEPAAERTLEWAAGLALEFGAQLTLAHVMSELDPRTEAYYLSPEWRKLMTDRAEEQIAALQGKSGTHAEVILLIGRAADMLCEEARKLPADLLVIGRGTEAGILGRLTGHAYSTIRQSPCPVVSV